ncbi:MAG: ArnT family glycosyltransferase [Bdellovibrionales bacterium]
MSVMLNHMQFVTGLAFGNGTTAQLLQFINCLVLGLGLFSIGLRYFHPIIAYIALALFIANDSVVLHSTAALVDLGAAFFSTFAIYAFLNWLEESKREWILMAGLMAGFSTAVKLNTAFLMGVLLATVFIYALYRKEFRAFWGFGACFLLTAGPWYLRNWIMIGNPVFPMYPEIFGYTFWSKDEVNSLFGFLEVQTAHERSFWAFLQMPYNMAFRMMAYIMEARYTSWLFYLLPFTVWALWVSSISRWLFFFALAHAVFWFSGVHNMRHFFPALPLYCIFIASGVLFFKKFWPELWHRFSPMVLKGIFLFAVLRSSHYAQWIITGTPLYSYHKIEGRGPFPFTDAAREKYLMKNAPAYEAIKYLNEINGPDYRVYVTYSENLVTMWMEPILGIG